MIDYQKNDHPLTDREVMLWLANMNFFHPKNSQAGLGKKLFKTFGKSRKDLANLPDDVKINYAADKLGWVIPDSKEFIHRKDWALMSNLIGESLEIIHHPVFKIANEHIVKNFKQTADVVCFFSCSCHKPYSENSNYKKYKNMSEFDSIVMSNSGIIPIGSKIHPENDFSKNYPFRYYDWNHGVEEGQLKQAEEDFMYYCAKNLLSVTNYKKVAFWTSPPNQYDNYYNVFNRLKKDFPEKEWLFLLDEEVVEYLRQKYKKLMYLRKFQPELAFKKLLAFINRKPQPGLFGRKGHF